MSGTEYVALGSWGFTNDESDARRFASAEEAVNMAKAAYPDLPCEALAVTS